MKCRHSSLAKTVIFVSDVATLRIGKMLKSLQNFCKIFIFRVTMAIDSELWTSNIIICACSYITCQREVHTPVCTSRWQVMCGYMVLTTSSRRIRRAQISVTRCCIRTHSGWWRQRTSWWLQAAAVSASLAVSAAGRMQAKLPSHSTIQFGMALCMSYISGRLCLYTASHKKCATLSSTITHPVFGLIFTFFISVQTGMNTLQFNYLMAWSYHRMLLNFTL